MNAKSRDKLCAALRSIAVVMEEEVKREGSDFDKEHATDLIYKAIEELSTDDTINPTK